jgi:hypothetical protein
MTVRIIYLDGHEDIKDCNDITEICLDGVSTIRIIREKE